MPRPRRRGKYNRGHVWAWLSEWCADVFGATSRAEPGATLRVVVGLGLLVLVAIVGFADAGARGLLPMLTLGVLGLLVARDVFLARDELWRAARLPLGDPRQRPRSPVPDKLWAPTAVALRRLAAAIDGTRRGRFAEASDLLAMIPGDLLRPDETRLAAGARAMVSLGLGDSSRAAEVGAGAVPTGSDEMDAALGRAMVTVAWSEPQRLTAIDRAWSEAGVGLHGDRSLERLRRLIRVRLEPPRLAELGHEEARELGDEATAIGDDTLAMELVARARSSTYR